MNVHFVTLDVAYELLASRIQARIQVQPKLGALDPKFDPDVTTKLLLATKDLLRELTVTTSQQKNGYVLDAADMAREQVHRALLEIIDGIRGGGE